MHSGPPPGSPEITPDANLKNKAQKEPIVIKSPPLTAPLNPKLLKGRMFYKPIMYLSLLTILVVIGGFGYDFYTRLNEPQAANYEILNTLDADGFLVPSSTQVMSTLETPNLTNDVILKWAAEAATTVYTFDFYNYNEVFKAARPYFTQAGFDNFIAAINAAKTVETVIEKKLVVSSVLTNTPIMSNEGEAPDGTYAWQVQFPMLLTFQSASEINKQNIIVTLLIARIPTSESPMGIGIASFVVTRAVSGSR